MSKPNTRMLLGSYAGGEGYQIFTGASGVWDWSLAGSPDFVDVLVVGGGGSAGYGGIRTYDGIAVSPGGGAAGEIVAQLRVPVSGDVPITVGAGGSYSSNAGGSGGDSYFGSVRARGGGRGGGSRQLQPDLWYDYTITNGINGGGGASGSEGMGYGSVGYGEFPGQDGVVGGRPGVGGGYGTLVIGIRGGYSGVSVESLGFDVPTSYFVGGSTHAGQGGSALNRGFGGRSGPDRVTSTVSLSAGTGGLVIVRWGAH